MKAYRKRIKIPIYGGDFTVVITNNLIKASKKYFDFYNNDLKHCDAVTLAFENKTYAVVFQKTTPGIIAHEAKHIVNKLFHDIGLKLDSLNDEAETYLLTWIVNRIHECVTKYET